MNGTARWVYYEDRREKVPEAALRKALPTVTRHALANPRRYNRLYAMIGAAKNHPKMAVPLFREILAGKIEVRPFQAGEEYCLQRARKSKKDPDGLKKTKTDAAVAGFLLARLGDRESLPLVRKVRTEAKGKDTELLDRAIKMLTE